MVAFPGADVCSRIRLPAVWAIHESYTLPMFWGTYGDALDPVVRVRGTEALHSAEILAFTCAGTRACYEPYAGPLGGRAAWRTMRLKAG